MDIQTFLDGIISLINDAILPTLVVIAFVVFIWNATQYFIFQAGSEEAQTKAKSLALWSIIAFVAITSLWGMVSVLTDGLGLADRAQITPDYVCKKQGGNCTRETYTFPSSDDWIQPDYSATPDKTRTQDSIASEQNDKTTQTPSPDKDVRQKTYDPQVDLSGGIKSEVEPGSEEVIDMVEVPITSKTESTRVNGKYCLFGFCLKYDGVVQ
jgi:hypothetical protein